MLINKPAIPHEETTHMLVYMNTFRIIHNKFGWIIFAMSDFSVLGCSERRQSVPQVQKGYHLFVLVSILF